MNKKNNKKSPLKASPLRLPGQSLDDEIRKIIDDEASLYILIPLFALAMALFEWWRWYTNSSFSPITYTAIAIIVLIYSIYKIIKIRERIKNLKLGKQGEIAVGQYLELFREKGFKVFHDVVGEKSEEYNIDHVLIGKQGIFTIETKTYSKPSSGQTKIICDGEKIIINGQVSKSSIIAQAKAESSWLKNKLRTLTAQQYDVKPIILFPGWFVKDYTENSVWVLNPTRLLGKLNLLPVVYSEEDVNFIANNLSRYIRETNKP